MGEHVLHLPWGKEEISLALPESWHLAATLEPASLPGVADTAGQVRRSLGEPIGSPRLRELARAGAKVAVVIDDVSRPTPVALILPAVLEELAQAGVRREDIVLVTALGVHRPMQEDEMAQRVGGAPDGLRWENHNCHDPERLAFWAPRSAARECSSTRRSPRPIWLSLLAASSLT